MRTLRLVLRFFALLALFAAVATDPVVVGAQGGGGGDRTRELQAEINEESAAEAAAFNQLTGAQYALSVINARVLELEQQRAIAEARLAPLEAEATRLAGEYQDLQAKVAATQAQLAEAQREFDASAAQMYRAARSGSSYDNLLAARPDEIVRQSTYLDHISSQRHHIVVRVRILRDELETQRKQVESEKAKADAAAAEARSVRDQLASLEQQLGPMRDQAAQQQAAQAAAFEDIQSQKAQAEAELASLQATSDSISARIRAHGSAPGSPGNCDARPVPGAIVSGFGMRYHPILHYYRMHTGADMSAGSGTPIHACRSGTVIIAGSEGGYGNAVVIDHGGWMATLYAHQSRIAVSPGQHVNAGDVIGYVGSTGLATGPHLHFEVRLSGNPVDPAPYL